MNKISALILAFILFLILGARFYLNFQVHYLQGDESYLRLRQVMHIRETFRPLYHDDLSFSGRTREGSWLFAYALAGLSLLFGPYFGKIIPNLSAVLLSLIAYLIMDKLTKNSYISLLVAFISGFIPIFFVSSINTLTVYAFVVPLMAFLIYSYLRVAEKWWLHIYIITLAFYSFLHPTVMLFIIGLLFYMLLMKLEGLEIPRGEIEITLFSLFLVLWSQFLIYKNLLLRHGLSIIWQNIPKQILTTYFSDVTPLQVILWVGIIPFLYGLVIIWKYVFRRKNKDIYFLIGLTLSTGFLLWAKLIELKPGLIFFGVLLSLLFGIYYKFFISYLLNTRIASLLPIFKATIVISFILTSVIPSLILAQKTIGDSTIQAELDALEWLRNNSASGAIILGSVGEGNLINYAADRKNVIDSDFLSIPNSDTIFNDIKTVYTSPYETTAIELLNKHKVDYFLVSPITRKAFQIQNPYWIKNERCFAKIYNKNEVQIYKSLCIIE